MPSWGANIPHVSWPKNQNMKQKQCCNKSDKDFKKNRPRKNKKNLKKKEKTKASIFFRIIIPLEMLSD